MTSSADCPADEPEVGSNCASGWLGCLYEACGDDTRSQYRCSNGSWQALRVCDATCPDERPQAFGDCAGREGLACAYDEDTCGTVQPVTAGCSSGRWYLYGPDRGEGSPVCALAHSDGEPCNLPDDCERASCYSISCYGQPLVEECSNGVWRVQTSCSK